MWVVVVVLVVVTGENKVNSYYNQLKFDNEKQAGDELWERPARAKAQVSRTAPIRIFLLLGTGTHECSPIFLHALGKGYG